jgi:hypothetical protein
MYEKKIKISKRRVNVGVDPSKCIFIYFPAILQKLAHDFTSSCDNFLIVKFSKFYQKTRNFLLGKKPTVRVIFYMKVISK